MPTFKLVSFNAHGGLQPRRNGVCAPYDLVDRAARLRRRRDRGAGVVVAGRRARPRSTSAAAELGAEVFELRFGRGTLDPWPHVPRDRPRARHRRIWR